MKVATNKEGVKYLQDRFCSKKKNYKKAIKLYEEGLTINPHSVPLLYKIALAYSGLENHKKALKYWKKLVKIAPSSFLVDKINQKLNETHSD